MRDQKRNLPREGTKAFLLLSLTAICGEFPTRLLPRLLGSTDYGRKVACSLKKQGLLKTFSRDGLRGYRLTPAAKDALLARCPGRFSFCLTGHSDTNGPRSGIPRRLRLHRVAEAYVQMQNAGVSIFRDKKTLLFSPEGPAPDKPLSLPAFYSSREVKELGLEAVKIKGSRMAGVLLSRDGAYLTYCGGPGNAEWDYRAEQRAAALMQIVLCRERLPPFHTGAKVSGLLIGRGMEPFAQILSTADSGARCFFLLDGCHEHFYYLTADRRGEVLLRLLCDPGRTDALNRTLSQGLLEKDPGGVIENDAMDGNGNPVLFAYFLDIPRVNWFLSGLGLYGRHGTLVCFDFQKEALQKLAGENAAIQTISFEKFERRFFP